MNQSDFKWFSNEFKWPIVGHMLNMNEFNTITGIYNIVAPYSQFIGFFSSSTGHQQWVLEEVKRIAEMTDEEFCIWKLKNSHKY